MDSQDFQTIATAEQPLKSLLAEVADHSGLEAPETHTFLTGLEPLAVWACYALFRWSKMILDARQRNLELDAARQQVELINDLVKEGWTREQAQAMVPALLDGIQKRQNDSAFQAALEKALALVGQGS